MSYANPEDCRIMATIQAENRRRLDARIDRELRKRQDGLGDLYRRGAAAEVASKAARRAHPVKVKWDAGWYAVCACGWTSRVCSVRRIAEDVAYREREHLFRPLASAVEHSETPAAVKGVA